MANGAAESLRRSAGELIDLLESRPERLELAFRLALICALTGLVAEIYQTPNAALAIYVAFFLNHKDRTSSLVASIVFLALFSIVMGLILLVSMVVLDDPMWRVLSIIAISFGFLFLASASKLRPVGAIIALIIAYALDVLGLAPAGEAATRGVLYAWLFVGVPAGVSIVVNLLFAPSPRRLAERAIAHRLALAARILRGPDERARRSLTEALREGAAPIEEFLRFAGLERAAPPGDLRALKWGAGSTVALLSALDLSDRHPAAALPSPQREQIARVLEEMAVIFSAGGYPVEVAWEVTEPAGLSPLAATNLNEIKEALLRFAEPAEAWVSTTPREAKGFFQEDAFSNPDHLRYALKTTAAAVFCYLLYSVLDWRSIHTCFITCYIVALGTTAETVEKLTLRILGCIVGAAAGVATLVFIIPSLDTIGGLMTVIFLGGLVSAYVAGGSPRISYAGFQMAFAFFLCVVQEASPAFDLVVARDRVIGILIGNLITYLVFTKLWPVSIARRIDPGLAGALRCLARMVASIDLAARRAFASQAQLALGAVETELHLARYEPPAIRPSPDWLDSRDEALKALAGLQAPLMLAAARGGTSSATTTAHLEVLAAALDMPAAGIQLQRQALHPSATANSLQGIIDDGVSRLDRALTRQHGQGPTGTERYAPA